jgi:rod shape-determining protein MreC
MPGLNSPRRSTLIIIIVGMTLSVVVFHGRVFSWVADSTGVVLAPIADAVSRIHVTASFIISGGDAARRIQELEDKYRDATAALVNQEELRLQMQFYRDVAKIRERLLREPIKANIFSYTRSGGVQQAILNRGSDEGIAIGDVVMTEHEEFVGSIEQVFAHHAVVRVLGDAALEITARVLTTEISGLIRSERGGKIMLDLIQKDEQVSEGAIVVTSGDDRYPAGLIIGTVRSVDRDATTLFQLVRVSSAISSGIRGPVLVLRP